MHFVLFYFEVASQGVFAAPYGSTCKHKCYKSTMKKSLQVITQKKATEKHDRLGATSDESGFHYIKIVRSSYMRSKRYCDTVVAAECQSSYNAGYKWVELAFQDYYNL